MLRIVAVILGVLAAGCTTLPPTDSPGAPIKLERETVAEVQQLLNERGFDAGPADGIFGERTETALREFEQSKGLQADGVLDSTTYTHLARKPIIGGRSGGADGGNGAGGGTGIGAAFAGLFGGSGGSDDSGSSPQKTTGKGAAAGAAVGGLAGYMAGGGAKSAVVGALVGAVIGNYIEHQRVRSSEQVYERYGRDERVVLNDVALSQQIIRPGEKGLATVNYDVIAPESDTPQPVTHTMHYYHGDSKLASNSETVEVTPGGYETVFPLSVPEGAEEGEYQLVAEIQSPNAKDRKSRSFQVIYARNEHDALYVASVEPR